MSSAEIIADGDRSGLIATHHWHYPLFVYDCFMLKLLTAPVTNDRSPRYMERALAAVHQAHRLTKPITFRYETLSGRVGLFLQFADPLEELVTGPITSSRSGSMIDA